MATFALIHPPHLATNLSVDSVIFMAAVVPAESGHSMPDAEIREMVKVLARDDRFPTWTRWWEGPPLNAMLPDVALRHLPTAQRGIRQLRNRGWDVKTLDGDHLYVASHPAQVCKELGIG